ncbi:hypothetical protein cyc_03737 [Cyclospora cayetanensis]|uniref:Uncharacterized protein n=1 Tax=Cyclospora cayetanensis TaxID=88456 RepID=A0A1D3D911_9EIME|nr:hypothetical protein cyc_03737 [Cyclospora cayetanensis]
MEASNVPGGFHMSQGMEGSLPAMLQSEENLQQQAGWQNREQLFLQSSYDQPFYSHPWQQKQKQQQGQYHLFEPQVSLVGEQQQQQQPQYHHPHQRQQQMTLLEARVLDARMRLLLHAGGVSFSLEEQRQIATQVQCFLVGSFGGLAVLSPLQRRHLWQRLIATPDSSAGQTAQRLLQQMRSANIPLQETPNLPLPSPPLQPIAAALLVLLSCGARSLPVLERHPSRKLFPAATVVAVGAAAAAPHLWPLLFEYFLSVPSPWIVLI